MPNGGPGPINRFKHYYSYRYRWSDGYYVWENCTPPSPIASSDSEDEVWNKELYWNEYLLAETRVSIQKRRLLPRALFHYKILTPIAEFLGTDFDARNELAVAMSRPPGA